MKITPKLEWDEWIYFPIGSIFVREGLTYKCVESNSGCIGCSFRENGPCDTYCISNGRKDKKDVIYIKL